MAKRITIRASRIKGDLDLGTSAARGGRTARIYAPGGKLLAFQDLQVVATQKNYRLGAKVEVDESVYRYMSNGAGILTPGMVLTSPVPDPNQKALANALVYPIGANVFTVTAGATAITLNQYQDGFLLIDGGTGVGVKLRIASNTAALAGAACVITTVDPTPVALDATSTFQLVQSPYASVIVSGAPPAAKVVGVAPIGVPATGGGVTQYFWGQTKGPCGVLNTGATTVSGQQVAASITEPGTVDSAVADQHTTTVVGKVMRTVAEDALGFIELQLE